MSVIETIVEGDETSDNKEHEISAKKAKKPEVSQNNAESEEEEAVEKTEAPQVDYKAELLKEQKRREKAEFALYKKSKAAKKPTENNEEENEAPSIRDEVAFVLREQRELDAEDVFEEELASLTDNEDERDLIRFKYENSLVKTGLSRNAIKSDLADAQFLANKGKYQRERSELSKAAISKRTMGTAGGGASQEKARAEGDLSKFFSKGDWAYIQQQNFTKEQIKKLIDNRK